MGTRKLGPSGEEVTLPKVRVSLPVTVDKGVDRAEMSDGSTRWGFYKKYRNWELTFPYLTRAELTALEVLHSFNQILKWQDTDVSETWYNVVITDFSFNTEDPMAVYFYGSMTLEEAI